MSHLTAKEDDSPITIRGNAHATCPPCNVSADSVETADGTSSTQSYRPDIDGLRAIAVLAVVLFHVGFSSLSGGFVGVDIFFVISGFLITRLLVAEIQRSGRVDFWNFYLRRMRRLIPAMLFTVIVSTVVAVIEFTPQRLQAYGGSLLHTVLSASNIFFFSESGYFDSDSDLKPLLHTWSLAVEEQFYLLWPILVLLIGVRKQISATLFLGLGLISFACAELLLASHPSAVFFFMPFRIVEFAIGALVVWGNELKPTRHVTANSLLTFGVILLIAPVLLYSDVTPFPGTTALLPCIGTALCIHCGDRAPWARLLTSRLLVGIGLISYSLYLIHWPIIVFYRHLSRTQSFSPLESLSLLAASVAAGVLMYFLVEKPFRKKQENVRGFILSIVLLGIGISYIGASAWATGGWSWRPWLSNAISIEAIEKGKDARFTVRRSLCDKKGWEKCDRPAEGDVVKGLILGDSHAPDALNAFYELFPSHDFSMSTLGGCPPHPDITSITLPSHPDRAACIEINKERYDLSYLNKFDYIVINVLFGWYTSDHLGDYLSFLRANGIERVFVFGGYYSLKEELPELINTFGFVPHDIERFIDFKADNDEALKRFTEENGYIFISKREAFCKHSSCQFFDKDGTPFTYDKHHLSYQFSKGMALPKRNEIMSLLNSTRSASPSTEREASSGSLRIDTWGPQSSPLGTVPNRQPSGALGIWIKVLSTDNLGEIQVVFDNQPATITTVQPGLITAAIDPTMLSTVGKKLVAVKRLKDGQTDAVGTFEVTAK